MDLEGQFVVVYSEWLYKAIYSLMGYMLSLLLYSKKIAYKTSSRLIVS
jgi:hypothetical protein